MSKPEWGSKLTCQSCGAVFYDMRKTPPTCPKCGTEQEPERPRARRAAAVAEPVRKAPVPEKIAAEPDLEVEIGGELLEEETEDDTEEDFLEDTSDIGDDEDDVAGVIDGIDETGEKE